MPSPRSLLPWLLGGAVGLGGILQGWHWRATGSSAGTEELENQLRIALEEKELLERENESLRSLAQGGGEIAVPQEVIDRVEAEFDLRFLSSPVIHRIASEELRDRIAAAYESRFGPAGIDYREEAYRRIGWLRPEDKLLAQLTAVRAVGAVGWFDEVTGEGWVTDRFQMENIPDQAALIRLAARILLHQHFPPPPAYPGDEAARAREALHQGAASGAEARFYAANARQIGFMPMKENLEAEQLLGSLSPFMQGLAMFPVIDGKRLADTLHVQGKLSDALRNPPQTSRAILRPVEETEEAGTLDLGWVSGEPFLVESGGQLGLRLWLEPMEDLEVALEVSAAWRNDRYVLFPDGDASSGLVWEIELDSAEAAKRLQEWGLGLLEVMAGVEGEMEAGKAVRSPEGRFILLKRVGETRVRIVNAADETTAGRLGS